MGSGWETAIAYLKLAMETAFETISEASMVLRIKDFVLLACSALGEILSLISILPVGLKFRLYPAFFNN